MDNVTLNRKETVLMIIDIQERLVPVMKYKDQVIDNSKILIAAAKEMNFPIIVTEQYPKGLGRTVEELLDLIEEENVYAKNSFTAYTDEVEEALKLNC